MAVFEQYREVVTADASFRDLDMEVKVTMTKKGKLKFDITLWNLSQSTWDTIEKGDIVQVKAGWVDGPAEVIIYGKINSTTRETDQNDIQFNLKGIDQTSSAANARISDTWSNKDPGTIAADIASAIGLSPQTINVGDTIQGNWSATQDQMAKKWLDELTEIAGEKTGTEWEWHGEQGELVFQPKGQTQREAPVLSYGNNLISVGEMNDGSEQDDSDSEKIEFEAMLVPDLRKGAAVDVQAEGFTDVYKVERYEHQTGTGGDHLTRGVLLPTDSEFAVESRRSVNTSDRALQNLGV